MSLSLFHLHGDLKDLSFPRLLATLNDDQFTGVFQATTGTGCPGDASGGDESGEATREVHFSSGHIAWAISTQREESLRAYMLRNGSLTEAQWAEAEQQARGGTVRDALVTLELVNARELTQIEKGRAEEILLALFSAAEGEYRIRERQLPPGTPDLKIDTRPLILKGVLEECDHGLIMDEVGSLDAVFAVRKAVMDEMTLPGEFQSVLRHVDGKRSIAQILSQTALPDNFVCSVLAALSMTGAIRRHQEKTPARERREPVKEPEKQPVEEALPVSSQRPAGTKPEADLFLEPVEEVDVDTLPEPEQIEDEIDPMPALPPINLSPFTERETNEELDESTEDLDETLIEPVTPHAPSYYSPEGPADRSRPWFLLGGGAAVGFAALLLILMSHGAGDAEEIIRPVSQAAPEIADSISEDSAGSSYEPDIPEKPDRPAMPAPTPAASKAVASPARANILTPEPSKQSARASLASGDFAAASRQFGREYSNRTGAYTIQLLTACQDDTIQKAVASAGNSHRLFILSANVEGRRCYRVYWGTYATQTRAQEALRREVPQPFRKQRSQPRVTRLGGA